MRTVTLEWLRSWAEGRQKARDAATLDKVAGIVAEVRHGGESALRRLAAHWDQFAVDDQLLIGREELEAAWNTTDAATRALLQRTAERITRFAERQRRCLTDLSIESDGMVMGHCCVPVQRAGCYAPGGRYPLPSSVLMTAVTAKVAGVTHVVVASPRPQRVTQAAAYLAGADALLPVGGAQAIAALAYGVGPVPRCDVIVGPGNRYVTAAKQLVSGDVGIDMLAGPSELVVVADQDADVELVAADLLAQAEHDPDALPVLIAFGSPGSPPETEARIVERVAEAIERQLTSLPTSEVARAALAHGGAIECRSLDEVVRACDHIAPEHLALHLQDPGALRARIAHFGAVFEGGASAEVLGDYGAGPNHVLPTGGQARFTGGLSVFDFLRVRTFLRGHPGPELLADVRRFAELEGLPGHARAAGMRVRTPG